MYKPTLFVHLETHLNLCGYVYCIYHVCISLVAVLQTHDLSTASPTCFNAMYLCLLSNLAFEFTFFEIHFTFWAVFSAFDTFQSGVIFCRFTGRTRSKKSLIPSSQQESQDPIY